MSTYSPSVSVCNFLPVNNLDSSNDAVVDSGCTTHTFPADNTNLDLNPIPAKLATNCHLPNGNIMTQSHISNLPIEDMPASAKLIKVYAEHAYKPLLSLGQLADAGYRISGDQKILHLQHPHHKPLYARRCQSSGMYILNLKHPHVLSPAPTTNLDVFLANNVHAMSTKTDLAIYYHRTLYSPVPSTLIQAIQKGFFATWPGLTAELISKHLPKSINTAKGHMKLQRQHVRSTQPPPPLDQLPPVRSKKIFFKVLEPKDLLATDLTGRFPVISSRGFKYICVCFVFDANAILVRPMKSRSDSEHIRVYNDIFEYLSSKGLRPNHHTMDNECSTAMRKLIVENNQNKLQLVPPHDHRTNPAEKAIDTFKCHFISGLCSVDPNFPLHLWCRLVQDCQDTLNMLRPSRLHPHMSAHNHLEGIFDYNATPMAPPGIKTLVYKTPTQRRTWAQHGVEAWYIGRAPDHYRNFKCYVPATRGERTAKTVSFSHMTSRFQPPVTKTMLPVHYEILLLL